MPPWKSLNSACQAFPNHGAFMDLDIFAGKKALPWIAKFHLTLEGATKTGNSNLWSPWVIEPRNYRKIKVSHLILGLIIERYLANRVVNSVLEHLLW